MEQEQEQAEPSLGPLFERARSGDAAAVGALFERLYAELRRVAHARLRDSAPNTLLDTTALVHESYARFSKLAQLNVSDRAHFLAYASRVMRSVIVDLARQRGAERRGGGVQELALTTGLGESIASADNPEVLRVHEALDELAAIEPRLAQVVEMRYYGGLEHAEIATALGVGLRTVERDWERARSFLYAALNG
jgi:RNA polymerase sigma factor (TIGR02999 family)